jgi:hypothetical protein
MLRILTPLAEHYLIDKDFNIIRTDIKGFKASGQWKLLGLALVTGNSITIPAAKIKAWLKLKKPLLYKNGHPRYTIVDLDHGTLRIWGNTVYHGIQKIWED